MDSFMFGRRKIYTDADEITKKNIIPILQKAFLIHARNRIEIFRLIGYEKGKQEIRNRKKEIRSEINVKVADNLASEITEFKLGYEFGSPITYVQRARYCQHNKKRKEANQEADDRIAYLNEMMEEEGKAAKDQELARYFKICGVGYRGVFPKEVVVGTSVFDLVTLHPAFTFIVYKNDMYKKPIMAVSYIEKENGERVFGCYTKDKYFRVGGILDIGEISIGDGINRQSYVMEEPNTIGKIPIIEYINDYDRMGCFEKFISEMDAVNIVTSDRVNDLSQHVQAILWLHNCIVDEQQKGKLQDGGLLVTKSTGDGKEPKVQYVQSTLNQSEVQTLATSMIDRILQKANVPGRQEQSGGSTGSAMNLSNGWQAAETAAKKQEIIFTSSEMQTLDVVLEIIHRSNEVDESLHDLELSDILPKFSRNKTYDLATKCNALSVLLKSGVYGLRAFEHVGLFTDPQQTWNDSKDMVEAIQKSQIKEDKEDSVSGDNDGEPKKKMQDASDQPSKVSMVDEGV